MHSQDTHKSQQYAHVIWCVWWGAYISDFLPYSMLKVFPDAMFPWLLTALTPEVLPTSAPSDIPPVEIWSMIWRIIHIKPSNMRSHSPCMLNVFPPPMFPVFNAVTLMSVVLPRGVLGPTRPVSVVMKEKALMKLSSQPYRKIQSDSHLPLTL